MRHVVLVLDGLEAKEVVLTADTRVDGEELNRFLERGGKIVTSGFRLDVDGYLHLENLKVTANGTFQKGR